MELENCHFETTVSPFLLVNSPCVRMQMFIILYHDVNSLYLDLVYIHIREENSHFQPDIEVITLIRSSMCLTVMQLLEKFWTIS